MDGNILPSVAGCEHPIEETIRELNKKFDGFYIVSSPLHKRLKYSILKNTLKAYHKGTFTQKTKLFQSLIGYSFAGRLNEVNEDFYEFQKYYFSESEENLRSKTNEEFFLDVVEGIPPNIERLLYDLEKRYQTEEALNIDYLKRWLMYNKLFSNS